jgi:hypothetical protein
MKKLLIALAAGLFAATSYANSSDDFVFENDTHGDVIALYVSPHASSHWGTNVLHRALRQGQNAEVYWTVEPDYDVYDIRVEFTDGSFDFTEGYDLSTIDQVWITLRGLSVFSFCRARL